MVLQLNWGVRLSRLVGREVDVRIVNDAPIAFKYNVTKGLPILERDESTWPDFRERTWIVYLDMLPFFEAYFDEAVH